MTPITIEGRAASYLHTNQNKVRFRLHAFERPCGGDMGEINLHVDHSEGWAIASTRHITGRGLPGNRLHVWPDGTGLAFRAHIVPTREVRSTLQAIASGERCAVSIGWNCLAGVDLIEHGERITVVSKASIREISFVEAGADETAFAWIADGEDRWLRPEVEKARRGFNAGLTAMRLQAKARKPAPIAPRIAAHRRPGTVGVPKSVRDLLSSPAWHEAQASQRRLSNGARERQYSGPPAALLQRIDAILATHR